MATYSTVYTKLFSNSTVQCRAVQYNFNWPKLTGHLVYTLLSTVYKPYTTVQCSIHGIWLTLYTDRSWGGGIQPQNIVSIAYFWQQSTLPKRRIK